MARGQERDVSRGGIDPYVQQSLGRGREIAENRLTTAMRESGAAQRQREQIEAQRGMQSRQMTSEAIQQAANRAQAEKMEANRLAGEREDRILRQTEGDANRALQREIANQEMEYQRAKDVEDRKLQRESLDKAWAGVKANLKLMGRQSMNNYNAMMSIMRFRFGDEVTQEKAAGIMLKEAQTAKQNYELYNRVQTDTPEILKYDKRLERPPQGEFEAIPQRGMYEFGMHYEYEPVKGTRAVPIDITQDRVRNAGSKIQLTDLTTAGYRDLEQNVANGKYDAQDIAAARAGIDAMIPVYEAKTEEASETQWRQYGKKYNDKMYWEDQVDKLKMMRIQLSKLINSEIKLKSDKKMTVGGVARLGLGPIEGISFGRQVNDFFDSGMNSKQILDAFTKSVDPFAPFDITEDMNPYETEMFTTINSIYDSGRTEIAKTRPNDNWGGAY